MDMKANTVLHLFRRHYNVGYYLISKVVQMTYLQYINENSIVRNE